MERAFGADFTLEGERYRCRDAIAALLAPWFAARTLDEIRTTLDAQGVCWGPYQTFTQMLDEDWRASTKNPVFGTSISPASASCARRRRRSGSRTRPTGRPGARAVARHPYRRGARRRAGHVGTEIGRLHDDGLVAGAACTMSRA